MKSKKKLFAALACITALSSSVPISAYASTFTDIEGHWASQTIQRLAGENIIAGMGDGTFAPNANVTRAQYFTMINRAFNFTAEAPISFRDVNSGDWIETAIKRAVAAGYLKGYEDNTARPGNNITRAEVAMVLKEVLNLPDSPGASSRFNDASAIPDWSKAAIDAVVGAGLARGDDRGNYRANDNLTRAESATLILNSITYSGERPVTRTVSEQVATVGNVTIRDNYGSAGSPEIIEGNVTIEAGDITVRNIVVTGDLTIADSLKETTINLADIVVGGTTTINGEEITVEVNNSKFANMSLVAARSSIRLMPGSIENLHITGSAAGASVFVNRNSEITYALIDASATLTGTGRILTAMITATGVRADRGLIENFATGSRRSTLTSTGSGSGGGGGGSNGSAGNIGGNGGNGGGTPEIPEISEIPEYVVKFETGFEQVWGSDSYLLKITLATPGVHELLEVKLFGEKEAHQGNGVYDRVVRADKTVLSQVPELASNGGLVTEAFVNRLLTNESYRHNFIDVRLSEPLFDKSKSSITDFNAMNLATNAYIRLRENINPNQATVKINGTTVAYNSSAQRWDIMLPGLNAGDTAELVIEYLGIVEKHTLTVASL